VLYGLVGGAREGVVRRGERGMGLLDRLRGDKPHAALTLPAPSPPALYPTLPGGRGYGVNIVGEANYQIHLERVAGGRTELGVGREHAIAELLPQPDNPYDPNAIAVLIEGGVVGYIAREDTCRWRSVVDDARRTQGAATCRARFKGGWDRGAGDRGFIGVVLEMADPARIVPPPGADEDRVIPEPDGVTSVTVTCEEHYQGTLVDACQGRSLDHWMPVITELAIAANPHSSAEAIAVRIQGLCVGFLTTAMSQRYSPFVERSPLRTTCVGELFYGKKKDQQIVRVRLALPKAS
jgi:hypothetical protein